MIKPKILYAVQGTGNGHVARAREILPYLKTKCDLEVLISGSQSDIDLGHKINYRFKGLSFTFGKKGGIDYWDTFLKSNSRRLIKNVKELPIENYDLVLNDFEPVSAWACHGEKNTYRFIKPPGSCFASSISNSSKVGCIS